MPINAINRLKEIAGSFVGGGRGGYYPDDERGEARRSKDEKNGLAKLKAVYDRLLPKAMKEATDNGVQKQWAKDYFNGWYKECQAQIEDMLDDKGPAAIQDAIADLRSGMTNGSVVTDFGTHSNQEGIDRVKKSGEVLFKTPANKIAILKKLGLTGAEFHAFCLMVKEQIK